MRALLLKYRPALLFIIKFIVCYFILNIFYGVFVDAYYPNPDPFTWSTTHHTSQLLNLFGYNTHIFKSTVSPNVIISDAINGEVLSVYEGCNSLNILIIFISFLFAFKWDRNLVWFAPLGIFLVYAGNLVRIFLLFIVSINLPDYLYFAHKYFFTAFIFMVVFTLWYWWLKKLQSN